MKKNIKSYKSLILLFVFAASCGLKTNTLPNGHTKIAANKKVYASKAKFDTNLLKEIDTTVVYEQYLDRYFMGSGDQKVIIKDVARKTTEDNFKFYSVYKFYANGNFNVFTINRDEVLDKKMLDPNFTGSRGVFYKEGNEIKADLITRVTGMGRIGVVQETFIFKGDTLIVNSSRGNNKYVKMKLPSNFPLYKADW
ncbi:hypothetical protein [Flavobacterium sp. '19STA2R22 D10 B1']|uniref:hypothetical protein n=1 Tax=Flavobacterium aerium TaxID=3037261 RepID=UPI00278C45D2|nr:hypothetical protein [Flavobacterium sp. '19STA2R22 D10 B1']